MNRADILNTACDYVTRDRAATHGDAERLNQLFRYEPSTGNLYWRTTNSPRAVAGSLAGCLCKRTGYRLVRVDGVLLRAHRVIWQMANGSLPHEIDHINGNRDDNRLENLRAASRSENNQNRGVQKNNTSGYAGVSFDAKRNKWSAKIQHEGKVIRLGRYENLNDAALAYAKAKSEIHKFHRNVVKRKGGASNA